MTRTQKLTVLQRDILQKIQIIQTMQMKKLQTIIDSDPAMTGCTPSSWVSVITLTNTHHIQNRQIKSLIKKGFLLSQPTDGWGPEIKPI